MSLDVKEFHRRAVEAFDARVQRIRQEQWTLPTPCTDWDVRELVRHLVHENRWTAPLMEGASIQDVGDRFEGELLGEDPKAAWEEAMEEAVRAVVHVPVDQIVHLSYGDVPARHYVFELATDHLIHSWDLAWAIGADESLDHDLVQLVYERMKPRERALKAAACSAAGSSRQRTPIFRLACWPCTDASHDAAPAA